MNSPRSPIVFRPRDTIETFFDGTELIGPHLVRPWQWRPDGTDSPWTDWLYAAGGRIPST